MFLEDDSNGDIRSRFSHNIIGLRREGRILPFYIERVGTQNRSPFQLQGSFFDNGNWSPYVARTTDKDLTHFPLMNGYINLLEGDFFPVVHIHLGAPHRVSRGITQENLGIHRPGHYNIDPTIRVHKSSPRYNNGFLLSQLLAPIYFSYREALKLNTKNGAVAINRNIAIRNINKTKKETGVLVREQLIGKLEDNVVVVAPSCTIFRQELVEAGVEVA